MNVGQIYSTLERLVHIGLVEGAGTSPDSLPHYLLTEAGRHAAATWMTEPVLDGLPEWTEMLDQVVVTSSIDPVAPKTVAERYRRWWWRDLASTRSTTEPGFVGARLALVAREAQAVAAVAWLGSAIAALADYDSFRPLSIRRPKRGRRANP